MDKQEVAPEGKVWVCMVCGRTSPIRYGSTRYASKGWDEHCAEYCELYEEKDLEFSEEGFVVNICWSDFDVERR